MALKQVLLTRKIAEKTKLLEEAREKDAGFLVRKTALEAREAELIAALDKVTEETPVEAKDAVEAEVAQHETDTQALEGEQTANDTEKQRLTDEISTLQAELDELNARAKKPPVAPKPEERKDRGGNHARVRKRLTDSRH